MKCVWLLAGLLLTALCCTAMPMAPGAAAPSLCCFSFMDIKIPQSEILSVTHTGRRCSKKGFIVTTKKRKICVGQDHDWIKNK